MKKYILVIVWNTGEKEKAEYDTFAKAEYIEKGLKRAFGNQVWTCINEKWINKED